MATERFNTFITFILKWECVFARGHYGDYNHVICENVAGDDGGVTYAGIDKSSHPHFNFAHPTLDAAKDVYFSEWTSEGIEAMSDKLGEAYFNCAVNCGLGRAKQFKAKATDASAFIDEQEGFYKRLAAARPSLKKFLAGWLNRTTDLRKYLNA
jgi:lysozyme family protein